MLKWAQWLCIFGILLTTAHSERAYLWSVLPAYVWTDGVLTSVFLEFRGIVFFLADYPLWGLFFCTLARVGFDSDYRVHLNATLNLVWRDLGGKWWVALVVWMALGAFWAEIPELVRYSTLHLTLGLGLALVIADWSREHSARWLLVGLLVGGLVQSGLAIAQWQHQGTLGLTWLGESDYWWHSYDLREDMPAWRDSSTIRSTGLSVNPNNLAGYLLVAAFGTWWLARHSRPKWQGVALYAAMGVMLVGLLTTVSRAALLGASVGLGMTWLLLPRNWRSPTTRWAIVGIALVGSLALFAMRDMLWTRFEPLFNGNNQASGEFLGRDFLWEDTRPILAENWLRGVGANHLVLAIAKNRAQEPLIFLPVHNTYLQIWTELGIVGLILFLGGIFSAVRHIRRDNSLIWGGALLGIGVIMVFDYYWWGDYPSRLLLLSVLGFLWGEVLSEEERPNME